MTSNSRRAATLFAMLLGLALFAAACGDDTVDAAADTTSDSAMDDMEDIEDGEQSHGESIDVPDGMAVPVIAISTSEDSVSGVNLFVDIDDFTIAPESASTDPVDGQGHLHLYIDGERAMRFYNTAVHLGDLEPGEHEITVEVSANNHSPYSVDGEPIQASTTVTVPDAADDVAHLDHGGDTVDAGDPAPTVDIAISEDPKSGWNLAVDLENLLINPEAEGSDPVDGEGHLHLYIDGERVTRLYGLNWHIPALSEGSHEVMVEVSANNHMTYGVDGTPIVAMATIDVTADQAAAAGHDDDGDEHDDDEHDDHGDHGEVMDEEAMAAMGDPDQTIEASVADGEITVESNRIDVALGSTVLVRVTSDTSDEIHLHGYDVLAVVTPDSAGELMFVADTPGVFEVELETAGTFLFEVAVS